MDLAIQKPSRLHEAVVEFKRILFLNYVCYRLLLIDHGCIFRIVSLKYIWISTGGINWFH